LNKVWTFLATYTHGSVLRFVAVCI
nr:hypothetical protein [Tanacetum cinerariifolium]